MSSKFINHFNVFGSRSSQDRDILVFLEHLPSVEECKKLSLELNPILETMFSDNKKANSNFGVIKDGVLTSVFKGTVDEVNNSIFFTYNNHEQLHDLAITKLVERDIEQKLLRVARIVLSFYSRTEYRELIKKALTGDLKAKIEALKSIDLSQNVSFDKKGNKEDIYKNIAFQWGQIIGLAWGKELYSKEAISEMYPKLRSCLFRESLTSIDLKNLDEYKKEYILFAETLMPKMKKLTE